jgi:hypothetical protein
MFRAFSTAVPALAVAAMLALAGPARAQDHDHSGDHSQGHAHGHAAGPVDCRTLAAPPWTGLSASDRALIRSIEASVQSLSTPRAAREAGFRPTLGNIPTMGVHWVHSGRMGEGLDIRRPDHLLFAPVDGEDRLVGVAFAFTDVVGTEVPVPFESELAAWHDHPEFARPGQSLHMLHVWFVPSSGGPFAGNNFWLPFRGAGIEPPSACWMNDEDDAARIQRVGMTLGLAQMGDGAAIPQLRAAAERAGIRLEERRQAIRSHAGEMDAAARAGDRDRWFTAADALLASQPGPERLVVELLLRTLTMAQMASGGGHAH